MTSMDCVKTLDKMTYVIEKKFTISFPKYSQLSDRLNSFNNETLRDYVKENKQTLAEAGFFSNGKEDDTICYYCGGGIRDWVEDDDPWEVHASCFTYCPFIYVMKGKEYVDKCLSSMKVSSTGRLHKCDQYEKQFIEHEFREEEDSQSCVVCLVGKREILFLPCKHFGTCSNCSVRVEKCVTCRTPITAMLKIYLV